MSPVNPLDAEPTELAVQYAQSTGRRMRLRLGAGSVAWGILGASQAAERFAIPAIRHQPPASGHEDQAGAWVAALFSHNERRAHAFASANQIPIVALDPVELLDRREIRCVYLSSHPRHRFDLGMAALMAGKHVLCEPPLALTLEETQALTLAAADRGLVLGLNFRARTNPAVLTLRRLILDDQLGDILGGAVSHLTLLPTHRQTWRLQGSGGGVVYDHTLHGIDLLRFLFHDEIATVYAAAGQVTLGEYGPANAEEEVAGQMRLRRQGILVRFHDAFSLGHRPSTVEFDGTHQAVTVHHWASPSHPPLLFLNRHGINTQIELPSFDPFWLAIRQFQWAVTDAGEPFASGVDGLRAMTVGYALHKSMRERVVIAIR